MYKSTGYALLLYGYLSIHGWFPSSNGTILVPHNPYVSWLYYDHRATRICLWDAIQVVGVLCYPTPDFYRTWSLLVTYEDCFCPYRSLFYIRTVSAAHIGHCLYTCGLCLPI